MFAFCDLSGLDLSGRNLADATLPFFIPFPLVSLVGTLGAFRIESREPYTDDELLSLVLDANGNRQDALLKPATMTGVTKSQLAHWRREPAILAPEHGTNASQHFFG